MEDAIAEINVHYSKKEASHMTCLLIFKKRAYARMGFRAAARTFFCSSASASVLPSVVK